MATRDPLRYVFFIAATSERVWEGFVPRNQTEPSFWEQNWKQI
jgi:hypothetical protein